MSMRDFLRAAFIIAAKEYKDALRSGLFLTVLFFLLCLSAASIMVASIQFQGDVADYQKSVKILQELGKTPSVPPQFFPLKLLRGLVDYLEMIGAILGILLGYFSIAKEKNQKTLQLVLTRPLERRDLMTGKILGNAAVLSSVLLLVGGLIWLTIWFLGGVMVWGDELIKLLLTLVFSLAYVMIFFSLAAFLSLRMRNPAGSLTVSLVIWLVVAVILPQIGDTMDPDNQIPGGFFKAMNMDRAQEKEVIARFSGYEMIRNAIEESSITKHYERMSFALLGIKDEFNEKSLGYILDQKWPEAAWLTGFLSAGLLLCYHSMSKRDSLFGGEIK
jgi:ABC-2 type transport system permease protein